MKKLIIALVVLSLLALGGYFIRNYRATALYRNPALAGGNGRIEATELNIAAKIAGKVEKVFVREGDKVKGGQKLVKMETNTLEADLEKAKAEYSQAVAKEISARAQIQVKTAELASAKADLEQAVVKEKNAAKRFQRNEFLAEKDAASVQHRDDAETNWATQKANLLSSRSRVQEAEANLSVAKADDQAALANIQAAKAKIRSIEENLKDSVLTAPLNGRIQYRIAEPGEGLSAGGRAINMVDLTDVYMTFYLPAEQAGKVQIGAEARIVLDAMPKSPIPARITYVASEAQFTPKTVETKEERQKLLFRIKAHIPAELLEITEDIVKTGLPGMVWVKLEPNAVWPEELKTHKDKTGKFRTREEFKKALSGVVK